MSLPIELLPEILRVGQKMPQIVLPVPSNFEIELELTPSDGKGWIFTGFMFGGHQADGSKIPSYDFITNKGITWKAIYVNKPPLETYESTPFYLTDDYLYQQIFYGPRPITEKFVITIKNTLDSAVYFGQTAYLYEMPLTRIMEIFAK